MTDKRVLDPCCGSRMMWLDRENPDVVFGDIRRETITVTDRSHGKTDGQRVLRVEPDVPLDFRALPYADDTFRLVVFDPPPPGARWPEKLAGCEIREAGCGLARRSAPGFRGMLPRVGRRWCPRLQMERDAGKSDRITGIDPCRTTFWTYQWPERTNSLAGFHEAQAMNTENTREPICPHCGHQEQDAWEIDFGGAEGGTIVACGSCGEDYFCYREIDVRYTTKAPIPPLPAERYDTRATEQRKWD